MSSTAPGQVEFLEVEARAMEVNDDFEFAFGEWCRVAEVKRDLHNGMTQVRACGNHYPFIVDSHRFVKVKRIVFHD